MQTSFRARALALALAWPLGGIAAELTVEDFVKLPKYEALSLSPDGDYLAAEHVLPARAQSLDRS